MSFSLNSASAAQQCSGSGGGLPLLRSKAAARVTGRQQLPGARLGGVGLLLLLPLELRQVVRTAGVQRGERREGVRTSAAAFV